MRFEKWQALGNDYVIVESEMLPFELTPARIRAICARSLRSPACAWRCSNNPSWTSRKAFGQLCAGAWVGFVDPGGVGVEGHGGVGVAESAGDGAEVDAGEDEFGG